MKDPFLHPIPRHRAEALPQASLDKNTGAPIALDPTSSQGSDPTLGEASKEEQRLLPPPSSFIIKHGCHSKKSGPLSHTSSGAVAQRFLPSGRGKNYEGMTDSWKTHFNTLPESES